MNEITVQYVDESGDGHAEWQGELLNLPQAIPGEIYQVGFERKRGAKTKKLFLRRVKDSADRRAAPCPYFGECGGCQLQHISETGQLKIKWDWLRYRLRKFVPEEAFQAIYPSPQSWNYRRRIQVHASPQKQLGFFAAQSRRVVPVKSCPLAAEEINEALAKLQQTLDGGGGDESLANADSFELTLNESGRVEILPRESQRIFLQSNRGANQHLLACLEEFFQRNPGKQVLELFAGSGNFTNTLSRLADSWTAVESQEEAVSTGQRGSLRDSKSIRWFQSSAEKYLKKLKVKNADIDLVLLDPPREGAAACMRELVRLKIPQIIYVSCAPRSLSRDLKQLVDHGYAVRWVQAFDFFPQTMQVETVVAVEYER